MRQLVAKWQRYRPFIHPAAGEPHPDLYASHPDSASPFLRSRAGTGRERISEQLTQRSRHLPFVVSLNLHRRHLNESQRAMVAAAIANLSRGDNQHAPIGATSQEGAAELLNVSRRSVQRAAEVKAAGAPELVAAVQRGTVSVNAAAIIAERPKQEQAQIVAKGEKEILAAAKQIRAEKGLILLSGRGFAMDELVKCPHCGGTTYRLLREPRMVECQDCGRSFSFDAGAQRQHAPSEKPKQPE